MFKLNFKIALRNIWKNKTSSLINISGLAIGLTSCLLLLLYVSYEWNFDKQSKDDAHTYQVMMNYKGADGQVEHTGQSSSNVMAPLFKLVEIEQDGQLHSKFELLKSQLLESGAVNSVLQSSTTITKELSSAAGCAWPGSSESDKLISFNTIATTYGFLKTTGVKLLLGRDFSPKFASDSNAILISHSALKLMKLKNPIGQTVSHHGDKTKIIGVFEDFILGSPFSTEKPLILLFNKEWAGVVTMRLSGSRTPAESIAQIERTVKQINPAYPVKVTFVNDLYARKLTEQKRLGILSNLFGGLAVFISCLGLFALASYSAEQRSKEVGIRKVLGASVTSLMRLLSLSFLKMVGVAIAISIPIANYIMSNWLKTFEFRTSVNWVLILLAAAGTLGIALFTVSFQAYKAAKANPVDALKYE